jgi:hypothetical protein
VVFSRCGDEVKPVNHRARGDDSRGLTCAAGGLLLASLYGSAVACAPLDVEEGCADLGDRAPWSAEDERLAQVAGRGDGGRARVLILGLDGATGPAIEHMMREPDRTPTLRALAQQGQHAVCPEPTDARCARAHQAPARDPRFHWVTASGWASVLTGVDSDQHCVKDNPASAQLPFAERARVFPSFFKRGRDLGWDTAAGGVATFVTALNGGQPRPGVLDYECGARDALPIVGVDDGASCNLTRRAAGVSDAPERDDALAAWLLEQLADPELRIVMGVFDLIDAAGHASGYDRNEGYLAAIADTDARLAPLLAEVQARADDWGERWLVAVVADHGGHRIGLWGDHNVVAGADDSIPFILTTLGDDVPLRALQPPVSQLDLHPTVMGWLGQASPRAQGRVQGIAAGW